MAFLDFSLYVSIKDADTVTRFKGLDEIWGDLINGKSRFYT